MEGPLRYRISRWSQLRDCLSNNSKDLKISVASYIQNDLVRGTLISVVHSTYGTLFSTLVNRSGQLISQDVPEMTTEQILSQLACFGFLVEFPYKDNLPDFQLDYLRMLRSLQYDKLRVCSYVDKESGKSCNYVTAFKSEDLSDWIFNGYSPSEKEYTSAVVLGKAFNLTNINNKCIFNWDWLNFVANIDDILRDNVD